MDAMLVRSPLASYSFSSSKGTNLHVCYQDKSGNIKQTFYDSKSGWHTSPNGIVGKADLNNGLAITGWASGDEERVYYIGGGSKIVERCWSASKGSWYDGELTGKFTAAHYSNLAAISFEANGTLCIRVYYQATDNTIREHCKDGEGAWFAGHSFPAGIQGSSIACTSVSRGGYWHWLFYQKPDTTFGGYVMANTAEWRVGLFKSQLIYDPCAYITCATYDNKDGKDQHRVFTIDRDNKLSVTEWNTGTGWSATKQLTNAIPFSPAAATPVAGSTQSVRVYLQNNSSQIAEWGTDDGKNYKQYQKDLPTN